MGDDPGGPQWQPIERLPLFIRFAEDGVALAEEHLAALREGIDRPYRLDEHSRARSAGIFEQTRTDLLELFGPQGQRWAASPGLAAEARRGVEEYQRLIARNLVLVGEILAACDELKPFTIEALTGKSDIELGIEASVRDLMRTRDEE